MEAQETAMETLYRSILQMLEGDSCEEPASETSADGNRDPDTSRESIRADHVFTDEERKAIQNKRPPRGYVCKLCNVTGHWIQNCKHFEAKESMMQKRSNNLAPPATYTCRLCHIPGHWIEDCKYFLPKTNTKPQRTNSPNKTK
ncbi:MAG: uncharacterized protein A8A55_1416 [Amphiamblys sp. WSBS2006]|nr:MAG: uncharacterized protein A8A55_1416 [Amphiamblys sp. WSBS2006]